MQSPLSPRVYPKSPIVAPLPSKSQFSQELYNQLKAQFSLELVYSLLLSQDVEALTEVVAIVLDSVEVDTSGKCAHGSNNQNNNNNNNNHENEIDSLLPLPPPAHLQNVHLGRSPSLPQEQLLISLPPPLNLLSTQHPVGITQQQLDAIEAIIDLLGINTGARPLTHLYYGPLFSLIPQSTQLIEAYNNLSQNNNGNNLSGSYTNDNNGRAISSLDGGVSPGHSARSGGTFRPLLNRTVGLTNQLLGNEDDNNNINNNSNNNTNTNSIINNHGNNTNNNNSNNHNTPNNNTTNGNNFDSTGQAISNVFTANTKMSPSAIRWELLDWFRILRSSTKWTSTTFRNAIEFSDVRKYSRMLDLNCANRATLISQLPDLVNAKIQYLLERTFFIATIDGGLDGDDDSSEDMRQSWDTQHHNYSNPSLDPFYTSFSIDKSTRKLSEILGLHDTHLIHNIAWNEHILNLTGIEYWDIITAFLTNIITVFPVWKVDPNPRFLRWLTETLATGTFYNQLPDEIKMWDQNSAQFQGCTFPLNATQSIASTLLQNDVPEYIDTYLGGSVGGQSALSMLTPGSHPTLPLPNANPTPHLWLTNTPLQHLQLFAASMYFVYPVSSFIHHSYKLKRKIQSCIDYINHLVSTLHTNNNTSQQFHNNNALTTVREGFEDDRDSEDGGPEDVNKPCLLANFADLRLDWLLIIKKTKTFHFTMAEQLEHSTFRPEYLSVGDIKPTDNSSSIADRQQINQDTFSNGTNNLHTQPHPQAQLTHNLRINMNQVPQNNNESMGSSSGSENDNDTFAPVPLDLVSVPELLPQPSVTNATTSPSHSTTVHDTPPHGSIPSNHRSSQPQILFSKPPLTSMTPALFLQSPLYTTLSNIKLKVELNRIVTLINTMFALYFKIESIYFIFQRYCQRHTFLQPSTLDSITTLSHASSFDQLPSFQQTSSSSSSSPLPLEQPQLSQQPSVSLSTFSKLENFNPNISMLFSNWANPLEVYLWSMISRILKDDDALYQLQHHFPTNQMLLLKKQQARKAKQDRLEGKKTPTKVATNVVVDSTASNHIATLVHYKPSVHIVKYLRQILINPELHTFSPAILTSSYLSTVNNGNTSHAPHSPLSLATGNVPPSQTLSTDVFAQRSTRLQSSPPPAFTLSTLIAFTGIIHNYHLYHPIILNAMIFTTVVNYNIAELLAQWLTDNHTTQFNHILMPPAFNGADLTRFIESAITTDHYYINTPFYTTTKFHKALKRAHHPVSIWESRSGTLLGAGLVVLGVIAGAMGYFYHNNLQFAYTHYLNPAPPPPLQVEQSTQPKGKEEKKDVIEKAKETAQGWKNMLVQHYSGGK